MTLINSFPVIASTLKGINNAKQSRMLRNQWPLDRHVALLLAMTEFISVTLEPTLQPVAPGVAKELVTELIT